MPSPRPIPNTGTHTRTHGHHPLPHTRYPYPPMHHPIPGSRWRTRACLARGHGSDCQISPKRRLAWLPFQARVCISGIPDMARLAGQALPGRLVGSAPLGSKALLGWVRRRHPSPLPKLFKLVGSAPAQRRRLVGSAPRWLEMSQRMGASQTTRTPSQTLCKRVRGPACSNTGTTLSGRCDSLLHPTLLTRCSDGAVKLHRLHRSQLRVPSFVSA